MKIVSDDMNGVGKIKGDFVYVRLDGNYLDCGINIANAEVYNGGFLSEYSLIDGCAENEPDFLYSCRNPIDNEGDLKVAILSKQEVKQMIDSLQRVYDKMAD